MVANPAACAFDDRGEVDISFTFDRQQLTLSFFTHLVVRDDHVDFWSNHSLEEPISRILLGDRARHADHPVLATEAGRYQSFASAIHIIG